MTFTKITIENLPIFEVLATDGKEIALGKVFYGYNEFYTWAADDRYLIVTHFATEEEVLKCMPVQ